MDDFKISFEENEYKNIFNYLDNWLKTSKNPPSDIYIECSVCKKRVKLSESFKHIEGYLTENSNGK